MSITFDEPRTRLRLAVPGPARLLYERSIHPARAMDALGPYLDGPGWWPPQHDFEGVAVLYQGGTTGRTLTLARLGTLPFFALASLVVYFWPGAISAIRWLWWHWLFTLLPAVLAHPAWHHDMAHRVPRRGFLRLLVWAEQPSFRHSLLWGAATAMAVSRSSRAGVFCRLRPCRAGRVPVTETAAGSGWRSFARERAAPLRWRC